MSDYVLAQAAEADLRGIIRYTRGRCGDAQARTYAGKLERCIERLTAGDGGKDVSELHPDLRVGRCERHHVFYLTRENAPGLIVAVLHERMDLIARVADRLA